MKLVLCYPVKQHHCNEICAAAPDFEVVDAGQERVAEELLTADLYCGHAKVPVDWDRIVEQGRLRWILKLPGGDPSGVPSRSPTHIGLNTQR